MGFVVKSWGDVLFCFLKIRSGRMGMTKPVAGRYCNWNWSALFGTGNYITPWGAPFHNGDEPINCSSSESKFSFSGLLAWLVPK